MALDDRVAQRTGRRPVTGAVSLVPQVPMAPDEAPLGACIQDPDRWMTRADEGAKELCRACPRRWMCAQDACQTPGAVGLWAGIFIPSTGRARQFALRQLQSLAERNGFSVRHVS